MIVTEEIASSATQLSASMENYNQRTKQVSDIVNSLKEKVRRFTL
jgi:methyl-accepting chemotaxis protein